MLNERFAVWRDLSTKYFEFYLEEQLNLLGSSVVKVQSMMQSECGTEGAASSSVTATASTTTFQLTGPLRQLPTSFIDASHEFMEKLYYTLPDGYGGDATAIATANDFTGVAPCGDGGDDDDATAGHNPFLYGEVTSVGVREVLKELQTTLVTTTTSSSASDEETPPSLLSPPSYTFVDLGSGTGKMVVEVAHLLSGNNRENNTNQHHVSVGIELDHNRAAVANMAVARMREDAAREGAKQAEMTELASNSAGVTASASYDSSFDISPHSSAAFIEGDFLSWLSNGGRREMAASPPSDEEEKNKTIGGSSTADDASSSTSASPRRTILFCCGVGFGDAFVRSICDAIDAYRLANSSDEECNGDCKDKQQARPNQKKAPLAAAVLLFKRHPKEHPLYTSAIAAGEAAKEKALKELRTTNDADGINTPQPKFKKGVSMLFVNTSWMDEAPAMVLRWV